MKTVPGVVSLLSMLAFNSSAFAAEVNPYEQIINTAQGGKTCLTLGSDSSSVSLSQCDATDSQQWIFVSSGARFYIKNKALGGTEQGKCLLAVNQDHIKMGNCVGSGGTDYDSKRLWRKEGSDLGLLSNKYIADKGWHNYLQSHAGERLIFGKKEEPAAKWTTLQLLHREIISTVGGIEQCVTLDEGSTSVSLQQCLGKDAQQWMFEPSGSRYFIKNKALGGASEAMCLLAVSQSHVKMASCASSGDNDYTSKRLWGMEGSNLRTLSNKFVGDLGLPNYLQVSASKQLMFGVKEQGFEKWGLAQGYGHIRNYAKGQEVCLALSDNNVDVEFAACASEARQDWRMTLLMPGRYKLTNRWLANAAEEMCLGSKAKMIGCRGAGYQSERAWSLTRLPASAASSAAYILKNKYREDLGKKEVLGFSNNTITLVPETQSDAVSWNFGHGLPVMTKRRPVVGDKKVLLLHTQYSDKPATDFANVERGFVGQPGDNYSFVNAVHLSARGNLRLAVDAVTDLDLGVRPSDCPSTALRSKAIDLAREKGFDASDYDYVAVELPPTSCHWVGLAAKPGSWAMGNGVGWKPWMWQHEFGHSLGGPHATSLEHCPSQQNIVQIGGSGCAVTKSGDPTDTLNGGGKRLYALPYLYTAGWVADEEFPEVLTNGTYKIAPLYTAANASTVKGVHILRSDGSYLVLEFRQAADGFEDWPLDSPFVNGVIVRVARFDGGSTSNTLVDTTPHSANGMKDAPLAQGKSVDDLLSGKRVTVRHIDHTGATVEISDIPGHSLSEPRPIERSSVLQVVEPHGEEVED